MEIITLGAEENSPKLTQQAEVTALPGVTHIGGWRRPDGGSEGDDHLVDYRGGEGGQEGGHHPVGGETGDDHLNMSAAVAHDAGSLSTAANVQIEYAQPLAA